MAKASVFLQPDERRDFALIVEDTAVYVDRYYLACWSPVFQHIFYPDGAPFKQPEGGMVMKEKKLDDYLVFLDAVCPTEKAFKVNGSNLATLVAYADEYAVGVLRGRCIEFMAKQLTKERVEGEALIEYLRLATVYSFGDLQTRLVPLVGQLSFDQIAASHALLPTCVLAAVYESKSKALAQRVAVYRQPTFPEKAFHCTGCGIKACTITQDQGASSCCNRAVYVLKTAVAQIESQCSFTCAKCSMQCGLQDCMADANVGYQKSVCNHGLFVKCDSAADERDSAADAAAAAAAVNFSAQLLKRNQ